ncbi:hypothetical protein [Streptomyces sp. NPDC048111]|uniref:hypothetical protein n=1 Tax=Streptomyces sp. NPDC048111 TaxID=3365500 RepID=UPI0037165EF1
MSYANQTPVESTDPAAAGPAQPGPARAVLRWLRRRTLVGVGIGLAAGAAVLRALVALGRTRTLDGLPANSDPAAAGAVYDALTDVLSTLSWVVAALGLLLALGGWLAGRGWQPGRARSRP